MNDLLKAVAQAIREEKDTFTYHNWRIKRVFGGMNGMTFRAEDSESLNKPVAVKIRKRDDRNRAQREYATLQLLSKNGTDIAPEPISLHPNHQGIHGDVVITSWVDGDVLSSDIQMTPEIWSRVINAFAQLHHVKPAHAPPTQDAVMSVRSTQDLISEIENRYAQLHDGQLGALTKVEIREYIQACYTESPTLICPDNQIALITCDAGPLNIIASDKHIKFVDWEYSGWGDPAMDIADLLVRPECIDLDKDVKVKILSDYAQLMNDDKIMQRILAYEKLMLVFWLVITSRGFNPNNKPSYKGARSFTQDQTLQQQQDYIQRIRLTR